MSFYSIADYLGDGSTAAFSVSFPYISQSHVEVYVDGILQIVTTDYTWTDAGHITLNSAPASQSSVRIKRNTPKGTRIVDFTNGSQLIESDLDNSNLQMLYIVQELQDYTAETLSHVTAVVASTGNVPLPANPSDDNAVLVALTGAFSWSHNVSLSSTTTGSLTVSSGTTLTGPLTLTGNATFSGDLAVGTLSVVTSATLAAATVTGMLTGTDITLGDSTASIFLQSNPVGSLSVSNLRFQLARLSNNRQLTITANDGSTEALFLTFDNNGTSNTKQILTSVPFRPVSDNTIDLGSAALRFRTLYIAGEVVQNGITSNTVTIVTGVRWNSSTGQMEVTTRTIHAVALSADSAWTPISATYADV